MINLLPKIQKEELEKEERLKIISILGIVFLSAFFSLFLILLSIKINLEGEFEIQEMIFEQRKKEMKLSQIEILEREIKKYNLVFSKLNSFYQERIGFVEILEKFSAILPKGIYLKSLYLNPVAEKEIEFSVSGFSPDRISLIKLKENLEKEKEFSEIYIPTLSLLSPENFSLKAKFKK
jgi:Tfp pilus assembly protein PilN